MWPLKSDHILLTGITKGALNSDEYEQVNIFQIHLQSDCWNSQQLTLRGYWEVWDFFGHMI